MKAAFFLGCTIPVRAQNYEMATRRVAEALGVELVDLPGAGCCGYPLQSVNPLEAQTLAGAVLADAEAAGAELLTICTACTGVLTEAAHEFAHNPDLLGQVNEGLKKIGKRYNGGVRVRHFARALHEDFGEAEIRKHVKVDLSALRIAAHYGCHYLKPTATYQGFDPSEAPHTLDDLIAWTGAQAVAYMGKKECCGGACLAVDENLALAISKSKLDELKRRQADAMALICPFCSIMYDSSQKKIETEYQETYNLPILYYPQLLGLAFGMDPKDLGFQVNRVKAKALLDRVAQPA